MTRWPTFLVLGPAGAGGSRLARGLRGLPGTCVAAGEVGFFSVHWDRGPSWYASWFEDCSDEHIAVGEYSSSYVRASEAPRVAARIDGFLDDVRLVAAVRHPVARAREVFDTLRSSGRLDERDTFDGLLHDDGDRLALRAGGRYSHWLRPYRERFADRLLVVAAERMATDVHAAERVLGHVGLPTDFAGRLQQSVDWPAPGQEHTTGVFDEELAVLADEFDLDLTGGAA